MNEEQIVEMTDAYITSYMRAMEKTKNPNLAVQAAMSVCMVLSTRPQKQEPQEADNPFNLLLAMALSGMKRDGESEPEEPDPGAEGRP